MAHSSDKLPIRFLVDNVRSIYNVGAIFRIADAVGIERLHLVGITPHPGLGESDPRPPYEVARVESRLRKTALSAWGAVEWEYQPEAVPLARRLKAQGAQLWVLEPMAGSLPYYEAVVGFPLCLVVGHEREGVGVELRALADGCVQAPMLGVGRSLNVAVALGVVAYEAARQFERWKAREPRP